jgi:flagellar basal-body rod protein FlgF/flagellar basal-body rod protein FlgG
MDSGYYAACTALAARTQALDTIANNLANASTPGYRAQRSVFSAVLAETGDQVQTPLNRAMNNYGIMSGTTLDRTEGALEKTGNGLDVAIQGTGFFVVKTPTGTMYTRNGGFQVSASGQLVTATGDLVEGEKGPIAMLPGPVSISADGTISSNGAVAGKLKLVDFAPGADLKSVGGTYYSAAEKDATAAVGSTVVQGSLENSNVNPVSSMVALITAQRGAEMMQRALSMFNSEMDKTAAQDLPKVS